MPAFEAAWNLGIPQNVSPDVLAAIKETAINDYLKGHRKYDEGKYKFVRSFTGDKQAKFSVEATVEAPLRVELPPFAPGNSKSVKFVEFGVAPIWGLDTPSNPARIFADNNTLVFNWTTADGKTFDHTMKKVRFQLEAEVAIVTDGTRHSINFRVTALYINQADLKGMMQAWTAAEPTCGEKISALFLSMLQVISAQIAGSLEETIEIPVVNIEKLRLYATVLSIKNKTVVLGASGDISAHARDTHAMMAGDILRIQKAFDSDVERVGGMIVLIFPPRVVAKAKGMGAPAAELLLLRSPTRKSEEIWKDLRATRAIVEALPRRGPHPKAKAMAKSTLADVGIGVGLAERLLQALASSAINVHQRNCTEEKSAGLIKGRACANVHVWNPVVTIDKNGLNGQVSVDVWAGIEYFLKKAWDCSWTWDGPHQIGIGITGTPKVTLRTISDRDTGLSIDARFDLKGVNLKTGISKIIDAIIAALDDLFIAILQAIFNSVAGLLSLVVVPVKIPVPGQDTAIKLANFATSRYVRGQARYLAVDCSAVPTKA